MLKHYHQTVGAVYRASDACVIGGTWLLSYWLRFYLPLIGITKGLPSFSTYSSLTPLIVVIWLLIFSALGAYRQRKMLRMSQEVQLVLKCHFIALLVFIALTNFFSEYRYSRGVMIYFGFLGTLFLPLVRFSFRNALRKARMAGAGLRNVLAVGEGKSLETLIHRMERFPELGLRLVGTLVRDSSQLKEIAGKKVLGSYLELSTILKSSSIDQVLIALPRAQGGELEIILGKLKDETVDIQIVPDLHEYITLGCEVEDFDGVPIVNLNDSPLEGWGAVAKRITDIALSFFALVILSPVFVVIALAVKLTSRGPTLFKQERMGLDGRTFQMLKFRSMKMDAETTTGAVWAQPGDQRRTSIGAFLRATSLDELPQFWNVLRGEMSLVGPRPERPVFVQQFRTEIPGYMLRHKVKAGITGWAQIQGWRGNTSLNNRIECDLYYIRNWSYLMDWKILLLTLWKGFIHKNAY